MKTKFLLLFILGIVFNLGAQEWSGLTPGNIYYNSGNVGIGTDTNFQRLLNVRDGIFIQSPFDPWQGNVLITNETGNLAFLRNTGLNYANDLLMEFDDDNGNAGIGGYAIGDQRLSVYGGLRISHSVNDAEYNVMSTDADGKLIFTTYNGNTPQTAMVINDTDGLYPIRARIYLGRPHIQYTCTFAKQSSNQLGKYRYRGNRSGVTI